MLHSEGKCLTPSVRRRVTLFFCSALFNKWVNFKAPTLTSPSQNEVLGSTHSSKKSIKILLTALVNLVMLPNYLVMPHTKTLLVSRGKKQKQNICWTTTSNIVSYQKIQENTKKKMLDTRTALRDVNLVFYC